MNSASSDIPIQRNLIKGKKFRLNAWYSGFTMIKRHTPGVSDTIRCTPNLLVPLFMFLFTVSVPVCVVSQETVLLKQKEDSLAMLMTAMGASQDDGEKIFYNSQFQHILYSALRFPGGVEHPFNSLKKMVKLSSDDGMVRFYQWNIVTVTGKFKYYGFLVKQEKKTPTVYTLADKSDSIADPDHAILGCSSWYGALYYRIITCKEDNETVFYTLIGWSGQDHLVTRKVIDILWFDNGSVPWFGSGKFVDFNPANCTRIIFRFDATATMSLKYEEQPVSSEKKWDPKRRIFKETLNTDPMIVFDRLIPADPLLEGQFRYYIPAGDVQEAFRFTGGSWKFVPSVEARNPAGK